MIVRPAILLIPLIATAVVSAVSWDSPRRCLRSAGSWVLRSWPLDGPSTAKRRQYRQSGRHPQTGNPTVNSSAVRSCLRIS